MHVYLDTLLTALYVELTDRIMPLQKFASDRSAPTGSGRPAGRVRSRAASAGVRAGIVATATPGLP